MTIRVLQVDDMTLSEIEGEIRKYERKYGLSFMKFMEKFNEEEASPETAVDQMIWETLIEARERKLTSGIMELPIGEPALSKIFTPKRMILLKSLSEESPITPKKLAEKSHRPIKAVYNDLKLLQKIGVIRIEGKGKVAKVTLRVKRVTATISTK